MPEQIFPEPTCGALILNPKGEIFLMKSHKWHGKYVIPGGHIELGEKMENALKREIKEETGLDIFNIEFLLFQEFIYDDAFWKKKHFIFFNFIAKTNSSDIKLNSEGEEYIWVKPEEAFKMPLEPYTAPALKGYLQKYFEGIKK